MGPIRNNMKTGVISGSSQNSEKIGFKNEEIRDPVKAEFKNLISSGAVKPILLTRGLTAIVDHSDADLVAQFSWSVSRSGQNWYAINSRKGRIPGTISMHRLIMDVVYEPRSIIIDHINGNGLDNRRSNLRICTQAQNLANQRKRKSISRFKGVSPVESGRWVAKITIAGKMTHLGTFETEEEAAHAYDEAARDLRGQYACLNFPVGAA